MELVLQHCGKTSWIALLLVLPLTFKPFNNLICCKTGLMWVVKCATSLFNLLQKYKYLCKTETTCNNPVFDKYLLCTCAKSGNPWMLQAPNLHLAMQSLTTWLVLHQLTKEGIKIISVIICMHASDATPVCFKKYWQPFLLIFFYIWQNYYIHVIIIFLWFFSIFVSCLVTMTNSNCTWTPPHGCLFLTATFSHHSKGAKHLLIKNSC